MNKNTTWTLSTTNIDFMRLTIKVEVRNVAPLRLTPTQIKPCHIWRNRLKFPPK